MNQIVRMVNAATRRLDTMFPGYFAAYKHNHYRDFGFPTDLQFKQFFDMYARNGIARAGVNKTALKTWQDMPFLLEEERDGSERGKTEETSLEREIRQRFGNLRLWARLAEADKMAMVGGYAGVLLSLRDGRRWKDPVDQVPAGLDGIAKIIPVWAGQLTPSDWDTDPMSETYGEPVMYQFAESSIGTVKRNHRQFHVHPDRVVIWSADETVYARSILEPGYNDLMTLEKIIGAGGEGFWKNAKSAPVIQIDKDAKIAEMARAMGVAPEKVADAMNDQVESWQKGFDNLLMGQGMEFDTLGIVLPSPEHFVGTTLQCFAASINIPTKILVGMQTGERASTEDAEEWAQTNMSRRANQTIPSIMTLVNRFERFGILPERDWFMDWSDLTEPTKAEKIDRAYKMADTNAKMEKSGEIIFTGDEIRATVDLEPLSDAERYRDEDPADADAAVTPEPEEE